MQRVPAKVSKFGAGRVHNAPGKANPVTKGRLQVPSGKAPKYPVKTVKRGQKAKM
jgi:hypothetical protein